MITRTTFMSIICCGVFAATLNCAAADKPKTASKPEAGSAALAKEVAQKITDELVKPSK
jgi:hypothetical protein